MTLKGDAKFEEKLTCGLEHDKEYRKFSPEQLKVGINWDNDGIL